MPGGVSPDRVRRIVQEAFLTACPLEVSDDSASVEIHLEAHGAGAWAASGHPERSASTS